MATVLKQPDDFGKAKIQIFVEVNTLLVKLTKAFYFNETFCSLRSIFAACGWLMFLSQKIICKNVSAAFIGFRFFGDGDFSVLIVAILRHLSLTSFRGHRNSLVDLDDEIHYSEQ